MGRDPECGDLFWSKRIAHFLRCFEEGSSARCLSLSELEGYSPILLLSYLMVKIERDLVKTTFGAGVGGRSSGDIKVLQGGYQKQASNCRVTTTG